VINTDCEGRLMLADVLARASADGPDLLLDLATLTSAQMIALGRRMSGVMANDDLLRAQVVAAADRAGEPSWGMPLPPELRPQLDSTIADIANCGPREAGMLLAGLFLREFVVPGVRWAHLDIAGPAYNTAEAYGYTPKGATGAGVRTLLQLLSDLDGR
jgi:leucyl aminopeptidase